MSKYRAQPVEIDGIRFASKAEGRRYEQLRLLEKAGEVEDIELQPEFPIYIAKRDKLSGATNVNVVAKYRADFRYLDKLTGKWVIEDVKGCKTPVYKLKKKLVEALYDIKITEVVRP